jgi:para-nitrobenzyl esterase
MSVRFGAVLLSLALIWGGAHAGDGPSDRVTVETGQLQGVVAGGVVAFKGIPFAAPPVGDLRWRPPQPAAPWSGVRQAIRYGHDCMQKPVPGDAAPLRTKPSEDCLFINVWRPVKPVADKRPVMVWIYGGGFVNGGSSPAIYAGTQFAKRGVVFVSFNYRLGRFGFFAHPALTRETPDGPLGNYAFMDQIAALKWVRDNIASFGGDPNDVTLFGESAGGFSVHTLMTSPAARGLFQKAIVQSGGGRTDIVPGRMIRGGGASAPPSGEAVGLAFAGSVGVHGEDAAALAALRRLPAETIVSGLNMMNVFDPTYSGAMIDGKIIVGEPEDIYRAGGGMEIPLIVGATDMDLGFSKASTLAELFAPFGEARAAAQAAYDPGGSGDLPKLRAEVAGDLMMVEPARFVARTLTARGDRVYAYRFSYVAKSMRAKWSGAPHASDIPFVFDTETIKYGPAVSADDLEAGRTAIGYWTAFAKTGDPNGDGRPAWPVYDPNQDAILDFTNHGPVARPDPWKARLDLAEMLNDAAKP